MSLYLDKDESGSGAIPPRDQIKLEDTWDLTVLFASPSQWDEQLADLRGRYEQISRFKGRVGESAERLRECLELEKSLSLQIERLGHYASLRSSEDSSDGGNLAREGQFENLLTRIGEASAFIAPEIQAIDDSTFAEYLETPCLANGGAHSRSFAGLSRTPYPRVKSGCWPSATAHSAAMRRPFRS
jgi:oligoendopeptidase F